MDHWRVAMLGDGCVGKTTLAMQFTLNCFVDVGKLFPFVWTLAHNHAEQTYFPATEGVYRKQLVVDNRMCFIEVIDTQGQEEYAILRDQCIRECEGSILVYSIASRNTFDRLENLRQTMIRVKRTKPIFMLVGNKCDKEHAREVSREEGLAMAQAFGCEFLETSAHTAQNVDRLFTNLVRMLRQHAEQRQLKKEKGKNCVIV